MPVTESDIPLLAALAKYYVLTREQLQRVTDREDVSDRSTRKHLNKLLHAGLISKHSAQITLPDAKGSAPVYFPTKDGGRVLASWFDDDRFLVINTRLPRADRLAHWVALNESRIGIERTLAAQSELKLVEWISEWEVINKDSQEKEHFTLQTVLSEVPPLSCSPDAGMLLSVDGESKVYYLEQDQGASSAHQVASRKCKGYAELARQSGHLKHFPQATVPNFGIADQSPPTLRRWLSASWLLTAACPVAMRQITIGTSPMGTDSLESPNDDRARTLVDDRSTRH